MRWVRWGHDVREEFLDPGRTDRDGTDEPGLRPRRLDEFVGQAELKDLDFIVSNPPFHEGGGEDKALGQAFIRAAAAALRKSGTLWLVANRHLPYEAILAESFAKVRLVGEGGGYKVFEARK